MGILKSMQTVNVTFNPAVIALIRDKIAKMKLSNMPLTSINLNYVDGIVEQFKKLHRTSEEYLSDLSSFS